jgi:flagellar motor switch protein FliG
MTGAAAEPSAPAEGSSTGGQVESSGQRKAAVFLAQMTKEEAGTILAQLRPREVESLTRELVRR